MVRRQHERARAGYKVVMADGQSLAGTPPVTYVVGATYRLPSSAGKLAPCSVGYHYCPVASDCMRYVRWGDDRRLFEVAALPDAQVVGDDGYKCVCDGLVVVADVTDRAATLLSATNRWENGLHVARFDEGDDSSWTSRCTERRLYGVPHATDGPAFVYRNRFQKTTLKAWAREGAPWNGYGARYSSVVRLRRTISVTTGHGPEEEVAPSDERYRILDAMLDEVEACERA
jgi:hypothetical protein